LLENVIPFFEANLLLSNKQVEFESFTVSACTEARA
jgi:hypothetical protein